ncbi:MAG: hypothetical protein R8P61_04220 [Bacteroidia bacterium]|nr:hypothetical protein [Bacteroidia bacterium]
MKEAQEDKQAEILPPSGISGWLRKLADESWQAELIISGIAIVGSLSLPQLITQLSNWCLTTFAEDKFFLIGMILMYLYIMAGGLIVAFLGHFFIRVLWIGMLGLSSVYPEGIKPIESYSDTFNENMLKEFPDIEAFSHKLDQRGSLIFSIASAMCMVVFASIMLLVVIIAVASGIHFILPDIPFGWAAGVLFLFVLIPSLAGGIFHLKQLRDKEWVKKNHFRIFLFSSKAIYTIFFKPFSYIIYTLISNGKNQQNMGQMLVAAIFMGFFAAAATSQSDVKYFLAADAFRRHGHPYYGMQESFYEDQRSKGQLILYANMESDIISGKFVKVFVPIMGRESEVRDKLCGEFGDAKSDGKKIAKQAFENECLKSYLSVYINESKLDDFSLFKYDHPETGQFGVNLYLSCETCTIGENEIRISRPFPMGADKPFDVFLPFMYEGE